MKKKKEGKKERNKDRERKKEKRKKDGKKEGNKEGKKERERNKERERKNILEIEVLFVMCCFLFQLKRLTKDSSKKAADQKRTQKDSIYKSMGVVNSYAWKGYN